jgi:hypothetical protein
VALYVRAGWRCFMPDDGARCRYARVTGSFVFFLAQMSRDLGTQAQLVIACELRWALRLVPQRDCSTVAPLVMQDGPQCTVLYHGRVNPGQGWGWGCLIVITRPAFAPECDPSKVTQKIHRSIINLVLLASLRDNHQTDQFQAIESASNHVGPFSPGSSHRGGCKPSPRRGHWRAREYGPFAST